MLMDDNDNANSCLAMAQHALSHPRHSTLAHLQDGGMTAQHTILRVVLLCCCPCPGILVLAVLSSPSLPSSLLSPFPSPSPAISPSPAVSLLPSPLSHDDDDMITTPSRLSCCRRRLAAAFGPVILHRLALPLPLILSHLMTGPM